MNRRRVSRVGLAFAAAAMLVLTGCGVTTQDPVKEPHPVEAPLDRTDVSAVQLPIPYQETTVVEPGWETEPKYANGVFLAAAERDSVLEFTAVNVQGEVLWAAERPVDGTGFTLTTTAAGQSLAVLTDVQTTDGTLAGATATAYNLITGSQVWGPVDVPGPHQGPGLIFAASPEGTMEEDGPRTALDPTTGRVVASETDAASPRVLGEYHGTLILHDGNELVGLDTGNDQELWRQPWAAHGQILASATPSLHAAPGGGYVSLDAPELPGALLALDTGAVLTENSLEAAVDPTSKHLAVVDENGLHSYDPTGERLWSLSVEPETSIAALGGGLVYLRHDGTVRVHNIITGDIAEAYDPEGDGPITVPTYITAEGAALLSDGNRQLLATIEPPPGTEPSS